MTLPVPPASLCVNARGIPIFDDPRFHEAATDRSDPPYFRYREYSPGDYVIIGSKGETYSAQSSKYREDLDLFDHNTKRFICEDGVKDIDEAIDILNESRWTQI